MGREKEIRLAALAGIVVLSLATPPPAWAGAPSGHNLGVQRFEHLDLRPPMNVIAGAAKESNAFPSALRRQTLGSPDKLGSADKFGLSSGAMPAREPGRIEEMARKFHREGLPVARLWENKSALVSLGLNQRGKPGLWLIQKVH
ncbi:MAG TPA: hypothetical protein VHZ53_01455 [Steroidobacteraceae bacterium]|jgi:hypothetical protein|nr:hypothetical protein [Steroidobacteraceae bacterium]